MIIRIFTVYDEKAAAYLPPFSFGQIGEAVRSFIDAANHADHKFNKNAEDFTLYHLGSFDDHEGSFNLLDQPDLIGRADIMRKQHNEGLQKANELAIARQNKQRA